jgi:hypothetical protein
MGEGFEVASAALAAGALRTCWTGGGGAGRATGAVMATGAGEGMGGACVIFTARPPAIPAPATNKPMCRGFMLSFAYAFFCLTHGR